MHPRHIIWFFRVCSFQRTMIHGDTKNYPNPLFGRAQGQQSWCKALKTRSSFPLAAFHFYEFRLASPFQEQILLKKEASPGRRPTAHSRSSCKLCTTLSTDRCTRDNRLIDLPEAIDRSTLGQVCSTSCCYWAVA
jgi:hypothetical protein